jgi:hypothetical protein
MLFLKSVSVETCRVTSTSDALARRAFAARWYPPLDAARARRHRPLRASDRDDALHVAVVLHSYPEEEIPGYDEEEWRNVADVRPWRCWLDT